MEEYGGKVCGGQVGGEEEKGNEGGGGGGSQNLPESRGEFVVWSDVPIFQILQSVAICYLLYKI